VWKPASSCLLEAKAFIPGDDLRVLGDDAHADDSSSSGSRLPENMSNELGSETSAALLGGNTEPFQVRHGGRSELHGNASGYRPVRIEQVVGNAPTEIRSDPVRLAVRWVGRRVLALQSEPLGNIAEGASEEASDELRVFESRLPNRDIHPESTARHLADRLLFR
jgi:hypothetical protein